MPAASSTFYAATVSSLPGAYRCVEEKVLAATATTVDFDTVLDGNVDKSYICEFDIVNGVNAACAFAIRMNGATATLTRQLLQVVSTTVGGALGTSSTFATCAASSGVGNSFYSRWYLPRAETGRKRYLETVSNHGSSGANATELQICTFALTTPGISTNLTSLGVVALSADGLGVGTTMRLYKRVS